MSDGTQIIVGVILLIGVYMLTRRVHAWKMRRAYGNVLKDLEQKEALTLYRLWNFHTPKLAYSGWGPGITGQKRFST